MKYSAIWVVCLLILLMNSAVSANSRKSFFCNSVNGSLFVNTSTAKFSDPTNFGFIEGETLVLDIGSMNATSVRLEVPSGILAATAFGAATVSHTIPNGGITDMTISGVDGAFTGILWCYTAVEADVYFSSAGTSRDARLNPNYGDLIGVIYLDPYQADDPGLRLFAVGADGQGSLRCSVHQSDLAAFEGSDVNQPLPVDCGERIHLFRLTTGELQVTLGPDAEGKTYAVIFDPATMRVTGRA
jgi:hypothetical protein